ncbi:MAG TPA: ATP-binding protein [Candidatus Saccharimonadia bacterium]|nr:ATP-binding protein [Candidatus Saccharimonadia bacterium]
MTDEPVRSSRKRLRPHIGQALFRLANEYPTLTLTVVETVQNAIDASARTVYVGIDTQRRLVVTLDDGDGVTEDRFQEALDSVCQGVKRAGSLGRFGLGLISPLNKCDRFIFASQPDTPTGKRGNANVWTFIGAEIKAQQYDVDVPYEERRTLPEIPRQFVESASRHYAAWRTMVRIEGVTTDRVISTVDLDDLEHLIRSKLEIGMRDKGTTVHLVKLGAGSELLDKRDIDPEDYTGEPLEVVRHTGEACGPVTFELYRARKTGGQRRGQVRIMRTGDNSPITWREFYTQALGSKKLQHVKEAFDALGSGYFEGMVYAENIELESRRTVFQLGEALDGLYVAIYAWYLNRGKALYEDEHEARREQRYQELGERSLAKFMERFATNPTFAAMAHRLMGILPEGVTDLPGSPPENKSGERSGNEAKPRTKRQPVIANPPKQTGDDGRRAPHPQVGLRFAYELLEGSSRLWEFDVEAGVLTFNVRHPIWTRLDETNGKHTPKHDGQIMHLQEWLALKLLLALTHHDESGFDLEFARGAIDDEVKPYVDLIIDPGK